MHQSTDSAWFTELVEKARKAREKQRRHDASVEAGRKLKRHDTLRRALEKMGASLPPGMPETEDSFQWGVGTIEVDRLSDFGGVFYRRSGGDCGCSRTVEIETLAHLAQVLDYPPEVKHTCSGYRELSPQEKTHAEYLNVLWVIARALERGVGAP